LLETLREAGIEVHAVTLHVGPATSGPSPRDRGSAPHPAGAGEHRAGDGSASAARARTAAAWCRRTTTVRTLEGAGDEHGRVRPFEGVADVTIRPGTASAW